MNGSFTPSNVFICLKNSRSHELSYANHNECHSYVTSNRSVFAQIYVNMLGISSFISKPQLKRYNLYMLPIYLICNYVFIFIFVCCWLPGIHKYSQLRCYILLMELLC